MKDAISRIAVIPARGGSRRIQRKNIREFCGRPMLTWSIEAAGQSGCFDRIIVSTDDEEIAEVAVAWGAEVPFLRPAELADDHTGTMPVVAHAIDSIHQKGQNPSQVCCIYATAPFVTAENLRRGLNILQDSSADFAFSVTSYAFPIQRAIHLTRQGRVEMFNPEHSLTRSQDLATAYHDAGQFYWGQAKAWQTSRTIFGQDSVPVILPRHLVQDIDTEEDWERAEWMFRALLERRTS